MQIPNECMRIVKEAEIDALAAALGSVHGPYQGEPKLGFEEMELISNMTNVPLVLHGGSGIPLHQIKKAIKLGHAKINVNTESIQVWSKAIREVLAVEGKVYEPRSIITPAKEAIISVVKRKMAEFNTSGKA